MPAKYICPKCGRRFTAWGAEKVGFKCPADEWSPVEHSDDVELVPVGSSDEKSGKKASLKRTQRRLAAIGTSTFADEEMAESSVDNEESFSKGEDYDGDEDEEVEEEEDLQETTSKKLTDDEVEVVEVDAETTDDSEVEDGVFEEVEVDEEGIDESEDTEEWND